MPIYEFWCKSCDKVTELIMKISDSHPKACLSCKKEGTLQKLMSKTNFVLKGTGWYETDFKTNNEKSKQRKSTNASSEGQKKDSSKEKSVKNHSEKKESSSASP